MKGIAFLFIFTVLCISCKEETNEQSILLYGRASALYSQGNFTEAAVLLEGESNFHPSLVLRAKALYFSDKVDEAEKLLRRILKRNKGGAEASIFLARLLCEQGKEEEAQKITESVLKDNPQDLRALRLASDLALVRGDTEEAAMLLDRAVEASAEAALIFVERARIRWTMGNGSGALEDLRRAELLLPWNTVLTRGIRDLRTIISAREGAQ